MPVKELSTEDDSINVEMDPEDQVICMEEASKLDYKVLGWYHSHPTFPPQPSTIDIYNQVLQQHAHRVETRDGSATVEPYVAAIMSPYDHRVGGSMSSISWFYVDHVVGKVPTEGQRPDEVGCVAKELEVRSGIVSIGHYIVGMLLYGLLRRLKRSICMIHLNFNVVFISE